MSEALEQLRRRLGDRYQTERLLGQGGMGAVYLARDRQLDRFVALKVLPQEFAAQPDLRERFLRETRLAAGFSHPNIVPVFAVEEREDLLAFAMGYVEGESLADRIRRDGPLPVRDAVRLLQDVAYALAYAHGRGVVHRDIKPDNILIERATGRAQVMDFGIARAIDAPADRPGLTRVGEVVGTPEYMSPEQASGDQVDGRSDLYALGLVAWFALTGRTAMTADSTHRVLVKQLTEPVPELEVLRPGLPPALVAVVARCCEKSPEDRYADAGELVEALDHAQLAASEVPAPVRQLAQDASSMGLATIFLLVIGLREARAVLQLNWDIFDAAIRFAVLGAVLVARLAQLRGDARRLLQRGFAVEELVHGFAQIVAEREEERAVRQLDPLVHRRRRQEIIAACLLLAAFPLVVWIVRTYLRVPLGDGTFATKPAAILLAIPGAISLGFGLVLAIRSPLRQSFGERAFRLFWMRAPGRWFLETAGWGLAANARLPRDGRPRTAPRQSEASATPARRAEPVARSLEERVAALEAWRDRHGPT